MFFKRLLMQLKLKYLVLAVALFTVIKIFGGFTHLFEENFFINFAYPYNGDVYTSVLQLRYNQTPDILPIYYYYNYTFHKPCQTKCKTKNLRLVYIVKSAVENFHRRAAIRDTWGYEERFSDVEIRTIFLLGMHQSQKHQEQVDIESNRFKDIVEADFIDAYFNNTIKTIMGLKWAVSFCPNSKFYMFVDDDYYVSTRNVLRYIRNPPNYPKYLKESLNIDFDLSEDVRLYSGYVFFSSPHRHLTSKWYVSLEEYPYHKWPPYVTAGAYILSREAMLDMYYATFYTKLFRFDDIYMGILAKKVMMEPFHCDEFHFYKKTYSINNYQFTIASHGYETASELKHVWSQQKSLGNA